MALIQDLKRRLNLHFPGAIIQLSRFRHGERVGGSLVWAGFEGKEQIDRQGELRTVVRELPRDEQLQVSFIMTLTPHERAMLNEPDF